MDCTADRASLSAAHADALLRHRVLTARALLRRRGLTDKLRASLEAELPMLERQAAERGVSVAGWRSYPDESGWLGSVRATGDGELIEELPRGRRKPLSDRRPALSAGDQLDAVMDRVLEAVRASADTESR